MDDSQKNTNASSSLTVEDLYGITPQAQNPSQNQDQATQLPTITSSGLVPEETPIIDVYSQGSQPNSEQQNIAEAPVQSPPIVLESAPAVPQPQEFDKPQQTSQSTIPEFVVAPKKQGVKVLPLILVFIVLFGAGIAMSLFLRGNISLLTKNSGEAIVAQRDEAQESSGGAEVIIPAIDPTPAIIVDASSSGVLPFEEYISPTPIELARTETQSTSSGVNRQLIKDSKTGEPFEGVSFELPNTIPPLLCDKPQCISQGTFLSGGTRFTVALRGDNQLLKDYRLGVISDASGKEITVNPITIQGRTGIAYTADFTGATVSNIRFTKIRGVMLPITDTLSFELNHFALIGTNADFDADEILFNNILSSIAFHNDEYSVETRSLYD